MCCKPILCQWIVLLGIINNLQAIKLHLRIENIDYRYTAGELPTDKEIRRLFPDLIGPNWWIIMYSNMKNMLNIIINFMDCWQFPAYNVTIEMGFNRLWSLANIDACLRVRLFNIVCLYRFYSNTFRCCLLFRSTHMKTIFISYLAKFNSSYVPHIVLTSHSRIYSTVNIAAC